jgi:hypothetical protein
LLQQTPTKATSANTGGANTGANTTGANTGANTTGANTRQTHFQGGCSFAQYSLHGL